MLVRFDRFVWDGPYAGSFDPEGDLREHGVAPPTGVWVQAARVVTGLRAETEADTIAQVVREVRRRQVPADLDPRVLVQAGLYRHRLGDGTYKVERGMQAAVLDALGTEAATFEAHAIELAETIARWLAQPIVVVEIQDNGLVRVVHAVSP